MKTSERSAISAVAGRAITYGKSVAAAFFHWSVAATLIGIAVGYLYAAGSWNPEWGPPFKVFYIRQREFLFAIHGGVIGAVLGLFIGSLAQLRAVFSGRKRIQFSLADLLLAVFAVALILLCFRGYLLINNASPYKSDESVDQSTHLESHFWD
jgi:hypothetical protein